MKNISSEPIRDLESQIRELEEKRQSLLRQRASELCHIIDACGMENIDPRILAGALQYIGTAVTLRDAKVDLWKSSGEKILEGFSPPKAPSFLMRDSQADEYTAPKEDSLSHSYDLGSTESVMDLADNELFSTANQPQEFSNFSVVGDGVETIQGSEAKNVDNEDAVTVLEENKVDDSHLKAETSASINTLVGGESIPVDVESLPPIDEEVELLEEREEAEVQKPLATKSSEETSSNNKMKEDNSYLDNVYMEKVLENWS